MTSHSHADTVALCRARLLAGDPVAAEAIAARGVRSAGAPAALGHLLGVARLAQGKWAAACEALQPVAAALPDDARVWDHLGVALQQLARHPEAAEAFARSLALAPGVASTWANAAANACDGRDYAEALRCADRALQLDPALGPALLVRGNALLALGRLGEAAACLERAVAQAPAEAPQERNSLGAVYSEAGQASRALPLLEEVVAAHPDFVPGRINLATTLYRTGRIAEALAHFEAARRLAPQDAQAWSAWLFALVHADGVGTAEVIDAHRAYGRAFERPGARAPEGFDRDPQRPLRIGFVSADLRDHALAYFIEPVWDELVREGFSIHAYHSAAVEDERSDALRTRATVWRNVHRMGDDALDACIRNDHIDILFDLSGHTAGNRLPVFARRPAPVQVSWMGYPATTGLAAVDYRLVNAYASPPGRHDAHFVERLVRLRTANRFAPPESLPAVSALPALERGVFTFASFNRAAKLNASTIALWAAVLHRVPKARMLVGGVSEGVTRDGIAALFARQGIAPERIAYRPRMAMDDYLALHGEVDLLLDSRPYSGGTTISHGLWMGVPTLTLVPQDAPLHQCHGGGMLYEAGFGEWVAADEDGFVARAVAAARCPAELARTRAGLRDRLTALRERQAGECGLSAVLRRMWRARCADAFINGSAADVEALNGEHE